MKTKEEESWDKEMRDAKTFTMALVIVGIMAALFLGSLLFPKF